MRDLTQARQLSTQELGFVDLSVVGRPQIVSGTIFLSGHVDLDALENRLAHLVVSNPKYRCRFAGANNEQWISAEDFDLDRHVTSNQQPFASRGEVLEHAANLSTVPFDGIPPWRVELVAWADETQCLHNAIIFYAHHAFADGLEGLKLLELLTDTEVRGRRAVAKTPAPQSQARSLNKWVRSALAFSMAAIKDMARRKIASPLKSGTASHRRRTCEIVISRQQLSRLKTIHATTNQSLILALVSKGISAYCKGNGFDRELRAVLPYGRLAAESTSFATNNHDIGFIKLPSCKVGFAGGLSKIEAELEIVRREKEQGVYPLVLKTTSFLPRLIRRSIVHRWAKQANVLLSVLPCGRRTAAILGAPISSICAIPAIPPSVGIAVGIAINKKTVNVVLNVDPQYLSDFDGLRDHMERAINECLAAPDTQSIDIKCPNSNVNREPQSSSIRFLNRLLGW